MDRRWAAGFLAGLLCLSGCKAGEEQKPQEPAVHITNEVIFNETEADLSNYRFLPQETADFREITFHEALRFFTEDGSGILYFGYDTCYWCNRAIPELNAVALEYGVPVYYVNTQGKFTMEEAEAVIECIKETFINDKNGEPSFYVPEVLGIKQGKITGSHVSLVDSFTATGEDDQMTDDEKEELRNIYRDIILSAAD